MRHARARYGPAGGERRGGAVEGGARERGEGVPRLAASGEGPVVQAEGGGRRAAGHGVLRGWESACSVWYVKMGMWYATELYSGREDACQRAFLAFKRTKAMAREQSGNRLRTWSWVKEQSVKRTHNTLCTGHAYSTAKDTEVGYEHEGNGDSSRVNRAWPVCRTRSKVSRSGDSKHRDRRRGLRRPGGPGATTASLQTRLRLCCRLRDLSLDAYIYRRHDRSENSKATYHRVRS